MTWPVKQQPKQCVMSPWAIGQEQSLDLLSVRGRHFYLCSLTTDWVMLQEMGLKPFLDLCENMVHMGSFQLLIQCMQALLGACAAMHVAAGA